MDKKIKFKEWKELSELQQLCAVILISTLIFCIAYFIGYQSGMAATEKHYLAFIEEKCLAFFN